MRKAGSVDIGCTDDGQLAAVCYDGKHGVGYFDVVKLDSWKRFWLGFRF